MESKAKLALTAALIIVLTATVFFTGTLTNPASQKEEGDVLFQFAAFNTFSTGQYRGIISYADLAEHGDFGIGTFDGLNGEMLAYDGVFYHIPSSGVPVQAQPTQTSPYATITFFHTDQTFQIQNLNYTSLQTFLAAKFSEETIYAIKIHGSFDTIQARSPQKQVEPYPNITEALKTQALFNLTSTQATAVGFFFPASLNGVDYAGFHMHIITDDHSAGGHILGCQIRNATVEIDEIKQYSLILP